MKKLFIPLLLLLATPALAQDVSKTSEGVTFTKPEAEPVPQHLQDWDRKAMNKQVDETLFNISGQCSGTLISRKYRIIVTNYHCVNDLYRDIEEEVVDDDTGEIKKVKKRKKIPLYVFQSKNPSVETKYRAKVEGTDIKNDIAILKVESEQLPRVDEVKLAADDWCERGMPAWAVGNPIMLEASVTKGVISYCDREMTSERGFDNNEVFTQIDVPIAGGSSGGGLFNYRGELIGVTNAGYRGTDMNFAVRIQDVKKLLKDKGYASIYDAKAPDKAAEDAKKKAEAEKAKTSCGPYGCGGPGGR